MQQYPNYLNQPYQQPINYPQYNYPQPQMERLSQLYQFQQNLQQPNQFVPMGKIVESIDIVKTTDIPMDGNVYYFPKADGTEIYAKQWMANGQTRILSFKPISNNGVNENTPNTKKTNLDGTDKFAEVLDAKFEELYKRIADIKPVNSKKKEVSADE